MSTEASNSNKGSSSHSHHHHHHHHKHRSEWRKFCDTVKEYLEALRIGRKYKDSTSKYRSTMRERRLRKKLLSWLFFVLTVLTAMVVWLMVYYAYYIDV